LFPNFYKLENLFNLGTNFIKFSGGQFTATSSRNGKTITFSYIALGFWK
jgi:hypothetical protein